MNTTKTTTLLALLIVLVIIAGLLLSLTTIARQQRILSIGSFEDCALAGYPIMESYPEQCRTPDGRTFVNEKQAVSPIQSTTTVDVTGCVIGGCSSEVCGEASEGPAVSNCIYRAEFGCYKKYSTCERQASGKCGWTPTKQLKSCLANPPAIDTSTQVAQ